MSVKIMSAVWELDLPQNQKLVLLAFADCADDDGICFPSIARIAWKTGYSERQIKNIGKELRAAGLLQLLEKADARRGWAAVYRIRTEVAAKLPPFATGEKIAPVRGNLAHRQGQSGASTGAIAIAPQSSYNNRHKQPSEKPNSAERSKTDRSTLLVSPPVPAPVIELPLNDGRPYAVLPNAVAEWKHLYPAVDVLQELRNMRGWLMANRQKRKTRRGIERFINAWLARQQDKAPLEGRYGARKDHRGKTGGAFRSDRPPDYYDRKPDFVVS